jgi:hypothetical protein
MVIEHKLFVCDCNSPNHQLIVSKYIYGDIGDDENTVTETEEIYFTVGLIDDLPFFKRLWFGLRYMFGRNDPQVEVILSPEKTKSLVNCLQEGGG